MNRILIYLCTCLCIFMLSCSDDSGSAIGGPGAPPPVGNPDGVLLPGDPGDNALAATYNLPPWPADETDIDGDFIKTRLDAMMSLTATVGEVNAVLIDKNVRIIAMSPDNALMTLRIDAVPTPADARALGDSLVATRAFLAAVPGFDLTVGSLPVSAGTGDGSNAVLPPSGGRLMKYAKYARMPAAWNAKDAIAHQPTVYVPDSYASTSAHAQLPDQTFIGGAGRVSNNDDGNHGFHVSGIIGGLFDTSLPTGAIPASAGDLALLSLPTGGLTWHDRAKEIADRMPDGRVIMNTSLGYNDATFSSQSKVARALLAMYWRARVSSMNHRFLHVTSAGNEGAAVGDGAFAKFNSPFTSSHMFADLRDMVAGESLSASDSIAVAEYWKFLVQRGLDAQPQNVIVVGSSDTTGTESTFSSVGPDVRAVGEEVWSACSFRVLGGVSGDCDGTIARMQGTSQATPQIAGLAAYMWSIDENLDIASTIERLQSAYDHGDVAGATDAYMAILSVDRGLGNAPVRMKILDVAGSTDAPGSNGKFDDHDLKVYLDKFASFSQGAVAEDYSRWDINGDGWTGGLFTARMDLTADVPPQLGLAPLMIEGKPAQLDETSVSDLEALCYYAYSALYQGDENRRKDLLKDCLALTTPPAGIARMTSANHSLGCNAQASLGGSGCDAANACDSEDPFADSSTNYSYSKNGKSSAACGAANASGDVQVDAQTDADPTTGVFTTATAVVLAIASASADKSYISNVINNTNGGKSSSAVAQWTFSVEDEPLNYTLTGNGDASSNVATGNSGFVDIGFREVTSAGAFIREIKSVRMSRGESDSWNDTGTLDPGFYSIFITATATVAVSCNEPAEDSTSNGTFTFEVKP